MKILGIHHVAFAVDDIARQAATLEKLFGLVVGDQERLGRISLASLNLENAELELVAPLGENSPVSEFLSKRGPGIHHICFLVDDINSAVRELKSKAVKLIDEKPRRGAGDSLIAFIHPKSTGGILIELKQVSLKG